MTGFWNIAKTAGGFLVGLVAVLTWLNVTPEMVGEAVYSHLFLLLPFAMLAGGALSGWGLASIQHGRRAARVEDEHSAAMSAAEDEMESLRVEAGKLRAFKERAEPRLDRLDELEGEFDLSRFNSAQLRYMIGCLCEESVGGFGLKAHEDNPVIDSLEDAGVLRKSSEPVDVDWTYAYSLTPDWRRFVARNQDEIRARIGVDER